MKIRIPRKKQDNKEHLPGVEDRDETCAMAQGIRAERSEEAEFEDARESEELPEHYRTKIDKY
ncbi:MAG TPA: hypothetical protein VGK13_05025 [Methanocellaceae archaeon]